MDSKAVVLLSGGLDSACVLIEACNMGFDVYPLIVNYGQRNKEELHAAMRVVQFALAAGYPVAKPHVVRLTNMFFASALTKSDEDLPRERGNDEISDEIGVTYVPARNTILLALAASYAESIGSIDVFIGLNYNDQAGRPSPDGRAVYVRAMELALELGTRTGVEGAAIILSAPFVNHSKAQIVAYARENKIPIDITWSCFDSGDVPCGTCDACMIRTRALEGCDE